MKNLVIVESPAKAKTIERYLGSEYKVVSSIGHIRDLSKTGPGGLGIDIENNYSANYVYIRGKKKLVNELIKLSKKVDEIYIATDPDREGEAIGWHLLDVLELDLNKKNRVIFTEITKKGILKGMENKKKIDMNLVNSQETRRKIDRIMGFKLSKLLQKKIHAKSAGRVQSVALKMIVEREKEIANFKTQEYFKLIAITTNKNQLNYINNEQKIPLKKINILMTKLSKYENQLIVTNIKETSKKITPKPAYTTSTFQQEVINKLGYSSKKTMMIAQQLYEGVLIEGELTGIITYMRTDSTRLSPEFCEDVKELIAEKFGEKYIGVEKKIKKNKNSQDGHEAIRPTNIIFSPEFLSLYLTKEQLKVYKIVWNHTIASLMSPAQFKIKNYQFMNKSEIKFKYSHTSLKFDGFKILEPQEQEKEIKYKLHDIVEIKKYKTTQHFTQPKSRYTEAKLIKDLEENGVGRPSTYSNIIDTLKNRAYVDMKEKKFIPTKIGIKVTKTLEEYFSNIINIEYTSKMETKLDLISIGEEQQNKVLNDFYIEFIKLVDNAIEQLPEEALEKTGNKCPKCEGDLVYRNGKFGKFEACNNFPKCRYITKQPQDKIAICPKCQGDIVKKITRRKKVFFGCSNYPKCDYAKWNENDLK